MDSGSTVIGKSRRDESQPPASPIPERLGDFRILREVGKGGMGIVYEAVQESLGRRVALKVLANHGMLDDKSLQRFWQESRAAASLHHTNIVPVFGIGEHEGLHYYVMQFIDGLGLREIVNELSRLSGTVEPPSPNDATDAAANLQTRSDDSGAATIAQALLNGRFGIGVGDIAMSDASTTSVVDPALRSREWDEKLAEMPTAITSRPVERSGASEDSDSQATQPFGGQPPDQEIGEPETGDLEPAPEMPSRSLAKLDRRYWQSVAQIGIRVAEAIDYAHGHGVLHRDIKPSNLLVDTNGGVWITDFGLAKAVGGHDLTLTGDIVGTIRYMAPERFDGQGDVRSDIYSLGLTLYELLTHRPAFTDTDHHRLMKRVLAEDPPRPRKLRPDVPRDLETIVLKAIAREPYRRYQTARELAEDLNRFVKNKPIAARQSSSFERAWLWCQRNPVVSSLTAALLLVFIVGFATVVWLWRDAEHQKWRLAVSEANVRHERDEARAERSAAQAATADAQRARAAAVQAEEEARKSEEAAKKQLELLKTNLAAMERQRHLLDKQMARTPTEADFRALLASNYHNLAGLQYASGKTDEAIDSYEEAIHARAFLVADHPQVADYQDALATSYHILGKVHQETGNADEALYYYSEAIAVREKLVQRNDTAPEYQAALAASISALGELQRYKGNARDARRHLRRALQIQENLVTAQPVGTEYREQLAGTYSKLGQWSQSDEAAAPTEAIGYYRQAVDQWQKCVSSEPSNSEHATAHAEACRLLADALRATQGAGAALEWYAASIQSLDRVLKNEPQHALATGMVTKAHEAHAGALAELGSFDEAVAEFDLALNRAAEKDRTRIRFGRALALAQAGKHLQATAEAIQLGRTKEALAESIYMAAKIYSVASLTVRNDPNISNDIQGGLTKQYADEAIGYLRACNDAGYFKSAKNMEKLEADPDFRHLSTRDDFQALLSHEQ
jgi:serine/threonine-protein kinase